MLGLPPRLDAVIERAARDVIAFVTLVAHAYENLIGSDDAPRAIRLAVAVLALASLATHGYALLLDEDTSGIEVSRVIPSWSGALRTGRRMTWRGASKLGTVSNRALKA